MAKEKKDKHFLKKPTYIGGPSALRKFITTNLRYPKAALELKIQGTVIIKYDVNHKGQVTDARVISGVGHGCNEEAIRLVKLLTFEVPKVRKMRVIYHKDLQIHFRLPKQAPAAPMPAPKPAAPANAIQYTITPATKTQKPTPPKPKTGGSAYSYTIKL